MAKDEQSYHELSFSGQIPLLHALEGVILLTPSKGSTVYVCREKAHRRKDPSIESRLIGSINHRQLRLMVNLTVRRTRKAR